MIDDDTESLPRVVEPETVPDAVSEPGAVSGLDEAAAPEPVRASESEGAAAPDQLSESGGSPEASGPSRSVDAVMALEEQIVLLLGRAKALWREAAASVHPNLQPIGYRMLSTLVEHGPARPGHLACVLETDKSVVSRQARELTMLGLIEVLPDPEDGRGRILEASPTARSTVAEMRRRALAGMTARLDALGEGEAERLAEMLARVNAALTP